MKSSQRRRYIFGNTDIIYADNTDSVRYGYTVLIQCLQAAHRNWISSGKERRRHIVTKLFNGSAHQSIAVLHRKASSAENVAFV